MQSKLIEQYNEITKDIKQEKENYNNKLLSRLVASFGDIPKRELEEKEEDGRTIGDKHRIAMLSLQCLRIAVNCKLISKRVEEYKEQLKKDIVDAIENVSSLEGYGGIDDTVVYDALDVMLSISRDNEKLIRENLQYTFEETKRRDTDVSSDLYFLLFSVSDYYKQHGKKEAANSIIEYLCAISREHNDEEEHREFIVEILGGLVDEETELSYKISVVNADRFENIIDDYSSEFFWLYGCVLQKRKEWGEAKSCFCKCYHIRRNICGEGNWFTDIARREYSLCEWNLSEGKSGRKELVEFIKNIEEGVYKDVDEEILSIIEGKTLYVILSRQNDIKKSEEYENNLGIYEKICEKYNKNNEPAIQLRLARNLRGMYYLAIGDYMQAERAFLEALEEAVPQESFEILTKNQIKSNLLVIYQIENDLGHSMPLLQELLELLENKKGENGLSKCDEYRIYFCMVGIKVQTGEELRKDEEESLKEILYQASLDICKDKISGQTRETAMFLLVGTWYLLLAGCLFGKIQKVCLDALENIEENKEKLLLGKNQESALYYILGIIAGNFKLPKAKEFVEKSIQCSKGISTPNAMVRQVLYAATIYYMEQEQYTMGIKYINETLKELNAEWKPYVRYLNDTRLLQILLSVQYTFLGCYAILRKYVDAELTYEWLLRFKGIASLAGRERNRIIHKGKMDEKLLHKIHVQQNKMTSWVTAYIFRDVPWEHEKEERELRNLEAEFSRQFSDKIEFTDITWEKVQKAIPNNSVVVEYYPYNLEYSIYQSENGTDATASICIDIYIIRKENQSCRLHRIAVPNCESVLEDAYNFVKILQIESMEEVTEEEKKEKNRLRSKLYQYLIKPIRSYVEGVQSVYIAPADELLNLPFGILYEMGGKKLENRYEIIEIESARDFLFENEGIFGEKGSLIIGNPMYAVGGYSDSLNQNKKESESMIPISVAEIYQLPFSEIEAKRIGRYCGNQYFSGNSATKGLFLSSNGYQNIHISTHGIFDLSEETQAIYSACLMFAGVEDWIRTGEQDEIYGNGIVTADEISRMDLRSVELAVLSTCQSGLSEVMINRGFHGLVGALSAAGVHYVISNLWAADDFGTAVLMDEFYHQYIENKKVPPMALRLAKEYLRNVTIGDLKRKGWFEDMKSMSSYPEVEEMLLEYEGCGEMIRPFEEETYWGGFLCYKCN